MIKVSAIPATPVSKSQGFTLIELMVTIAVLAIIVSIAAPNVSLQLANQRVKSTAATLENALKEARAESVIRRQNITVTYSNVSTPKVITITAPNSTTIASYNYNAKNTIKPETAVTIVFEPSKRVAATSTYIVCDSNTKASPRQISVTKLGVITSQLGGSC